MLVPVRPSIVDIDAVQTTVDICGLAKREPIFVLNAIPAQGRENAEAKEVIEARGGKVARTTLGERKAFRVAFNDGLGAQEVDPKGKAAAEIVSLFNEINVPAVTPRQVNT